MIESFAKAGDTLENMIYGTGINRQFQRVNPTIELVLGRIHALQPKVVLFSGGGNDVAGDEFESYLNHKSSGLPAQAGVGASRIGTPKQVLWLPAVI